MQDGYAITHKGLLAWTPLPLASERYALRCLFLVLECVFTLCFWAMKSRTKDYYLPALCPWPCDSLTYGGCCTHFSINEQIIGRAENATPEEINRVDSERKLVKGRQYSANKGPGVHAAQTKAYGEKALEEQRYKCTATSHSAPMRSFWNTRSSLNTSERPLELPIAKQPAAVLNTLLRRRSIGAKPANMLLQLLRGLRSI